MVPHFHGMLITTTTHNYYCSDPPPPMYNHQNSDHHKSGHSPMSPRISFSNDFAESAQYSRQIRPRDNLLNGPPPPPPPPPVSSDFEFSVSSHSMMTADELFCKGRFLPFKNNAPGQKSTTLREELLAGEEDDDNDNNVVSAASRPPKGSSSTRWKGFLGLKKSHIGSKKSDKIDGSKCQPHQDITGNDE